MKYIIILIISWLSLFFPNQPFSDMTVIGTYTDIFGVRRGVGADRSVFISNQSGSLVAIGVTNSLSAYTTNLSFGTYLVEIVFDDNFPLTKFECLEAVTLDEFSEIFQIECQHYFWFPYLAK